MQIIMVNTAFEKYAQTRIAAERNAYKNIKAILINKQNGKDRNQPSIAIIPFYLLY